MHQKFCWNQKSKEKLCSCQELKKPLRFQFWQLLLRESVYLSFPVLSWELQSASPHSISTNHFRASPQSREESVSCMPLLCHSQCNLLLTSESPSSLISTLSRTQNAHKPVFHPVRAFLHLSRKQRAAHSAECFSNILQPAV